MPKNRLKHDYKHIQTGKKPKRPRALRLTTLLPVVLLISIAIAITYWQKYKSSNDFAKTSLQPPPIAKVQTVTSDLQISG